jgi:hypothetical protein
MCIATKTKHLCHLQTEISEPLVLLAAILTFKTVAFIQSADEINNALNGFIDPENMGLDTNIKSICASHTEI